MPNERKSWNFGRVAAQFSFSTHFNSKTTGPIFTIFSHDVEQLAELIMRVSAKDGAFRFITWEQSDDSQFWRLQKSPEINWLP